jgi:catechol 2,3-dioxygenase
MSSSTRLGIPPAGFRLPDQTRLGRVRLQVADLERSLSYYQKVLGLSLLHREGPAALLGARDDPTPLVELEAKVGSAPPRARLGLFHFAILLPERASLGRFLTHVAEIGEQVGTADHLVSEAAYLRDPDGLGIEVYADRPRGTWQAHDNELAMDTLPLKIRELVQTAGGTPWSGMPSGTTTGHVHLHVGDLDQAVPFYHGALGMSKMVWSYPGALFLAAGGYHHHLGLNTWAGPHATPPEPTDARLIDWEIVLPHAEAVHQAGASLTAAGYSTEPIPGGWRAGDPWGTVVRVRSEE